MSFGWGEKFVLYQPYVSTYGYLFHVMTVFFDAHNSLLIVQKVTGDCHVGGSRENG